MKKKKKVWPGRPKGKRMSEKDGMDA